MISFGGQCVTGNAAVVSYQSFAVSVCEFEVTASLLFAIVN